MYFGPYWTHVFPKRTRPMSLVMHWARCSSFVQTMANPSRLGLPEPLKFLTTVNVVHSVKFPEEARGWILLHKSQLTEEQQAVVLARAQGSLKRQDISVALRSCYPDLILRSKKINAVHLADDHAGDMEPSEGGDETEPDDFQDVEALLSEHAASNPSGTETAFEETETAEVLAVSWKEKRQELARLQKTRKFAAVKEAKRSCRIEVEELKRRTKCHRCGRVGHWSRECKAKPDGRAPRPGSSSSAPSTTGAGMVVQSEHEFVAYVDSKLTLVQRAMQMFRTPTASPLPPPETSQEILLVSSPGHGVIDSGCGRTIIGADTLQMFRRMWESKGVTIPPLQDEVNHFKYGSGNH